MSRWIDGFNDDGFPWCPEKLPCTPGDKKYCAVCKEAVRQMDFMETAILTEKGRHDATFDKLQAAILQIEGLKKFIEEMYGSGKDLVEVEAITGRSFKSECANCKQTPCMCMQDTATAENQVPNI